VPDDKRLPAVRSDQRLVRKPEDEIESKFIEIEDRWTPPPPPSVVGQIVKAVVSSALDWLSERRVSNQNLNNRAGGETAPSARLKDAKAPSSSGEAGSREGQTTVEDGRRFGFRTRRRIQGCGSGNQGIRKKRKP